MIFLTLLLILSSQSTKAKPKWHELSSYTFQSYLQDFNKSYNKKEWSHRNKIFQTNLNKILKHNKSNATYTTYYKMGVNQFTDLTQDEIHTGLFRAVRRDDDRMEKQQLPFEVTHVSTLPPEVDWRIEGVVTPVKDQGHCGSCWAFSTISTLESHIALQTGYLFTFSPQELVSCTPNPDHCGGNGGCSGSTTEIGYEYVMNHGGIVLEDYYGYDSGRTGRDGVCGIQNKTSNSTIVGGIASIKNYTVLPSNNYTVLMNTIAKYGPVSVSVAANTWIGYESGILKYDDTPNNDTNKFTVNHAVNLVGYGTDRETGMDYWLVRNSWSPMWGENGYIRLERVDPSTLPDGKSRCGMDNHTEDGSACIVNGTVVPSEVEVCGTSAILSESTIPMGGYLIDRSYASSLDLLEIS